MSSPIRTLLDPVRPLPDRPADPVVEARPPVRDEDRVELEPGFGRGLEPRDPRAPDLADQDFGLGDRHVGADLVEGITDASYDADFTTDGVAGDGSPTAPGYTEGDAVDTGGDAYDFGEPSAGDTRDRDAGDGDTGDGDTRDSRDTGDPFDF